MEHSGTVPKPKKLWKVIGKHLKLNSAPKDHHRPLHTVRGHFSLTEIRGAKFPGHQTAATSLCALLQATSLSPSIWLPDVIDRLLLQGDKLHSTRVRHLNGQPSGLENGTLTPEQLPTKFASKHTEFDVAFSKDGVIYVDTLFHHHKGNTTVYSPELKCLQTLLETASRENKDGALLTSGEKTAAVMADDTYCYLFDPCPRHQSSVFSHARKAELLKFRDYEHLTYFLRERWLLAGTVCRIVGVRIDWKLDAWGDASFSCASSSFSV